MCACVPTYICANIPSCQRGLRANVLACQCGLCANVYVSNCTNFTCQRAKKRANVKYGVSMFKLGVPTAKRHANFSTWCANVLREISLLYYYIKVLHYTLHHSYTYHIYVCIVHKVCIILHF